MHSTTQKLMFESPDTPRGRAILGCCPTNKSKTLDFVNNDPFATQSTDEIFCPLTVEVSDYCYSCKVFNRLSWSYLAIRSKSEILGIFFSVFLILTMFRKYWWGKFGYLVLGSCVIRVAKHSNSQKYKIIFGKTQ